MTSLPEDGIEIAVWNRLENRSDQLVGETAVQLIGSVRARLPNGSVSGAPIADSNIRALRAINGATSGSSSSRPVGAFMFDCRSSASSMRYRTQHASIEAAGRWLTLATQFLCEPSSTSAAAPGRSTPLLPSLLPAVPHHHECYSYLQKRLLACAAKRKIGPRSSADHSRIPLTLETMWLLEQFAALFGIGDIYRQLVLLEDAIEFIRPVGPHLIALDRSLSVLRGRLTQVALTSQEVSMLSRSRSSRSLVIQVADSRLQEAIHERLRESLSARLRDFLSEYYIHFPSVREQSSSNNPTCQVHSSSSSLTRAEHASRHALDIAGLHQST